MARPRKVIDIQSGHRTIKEKDTRKELEAKIKTNNTRQLKAPEWLDATAKKEFDRVVKEMKKIEALKELLNNLDLIQLAIYADAYSNYIKIVELVNEHGNIEMYTNKAGATNRTISAYMQVKLKYIDIIMKCSTKLGLSVSDRLKLVIPIVENKEENPFLKYER